MNRLEHAIVTDGEINQGKYSDTGNDRMAQYPTERGLEIIKQHVVDKPAHWPSSSNFDPPLYQNCPAEKRLILPTSVLHPTWYQKPPPSLWQSR